jgi:hypothetical protein
VADTQQLSRRHADRMRPPSAFEDSVIAFATVRNGNTVLQLADRSTMTLVGTARIEQLTLFAGKRLQALRRVS